jgi:ABC-2 type transport system permease protein
MNDASSGSVRRVLALARHEYRAAARSRILLVLVAILGLTTVASVFIAAVDYRSQLADYEAYKAAAQAGGIPRIAPSPLALLSLLRGAIEYLEIIGAVIAITLGYLSVSRERANRTLPLVRSRPVTSGELVTGTVLGALAVLGTLVAATAVVGVLGLGLIGHDWVDAGQSGRLALTCVASVLYLTVFYCLGASITAGRRVAANGLMIALGVWLAVVLILPQIGDTLDPDNQVPGGLFAALSLNKAQEKQVLSHFATYETVRNRIEEASFSKHYERFALAMTDAKEKYRGFTLPHLLYITRTDIAWLAFYGLALGGAIVRAFRRQPALPRGGQQ